MAATLTARFFRRPSSPGVVVVRRDTDGYRWDFTNTVFSATPALDYLAPTEDSTFPGMYLFQVVNQSWNGLYQIFHYVSSSKTGTPLVLSINLTDGVQNAFYGDMAEAVRFEMDANSTQFAEIVSDTGTALPALLAAIESDTQDLQTQIGTAGAGLTALPWNAAWDAEINAEVVDVLRTDTLPDSYAAHEAQPTIAQAILAIHQFLMERAVSGTTVTVQKPDGTTTAMTLTLDDGTNPTSVHRSA